MIARKFRFHGYGSLNFVYKSGQTVRGTLCALKYAKNTRRKNNRIAVVVSKKVHKSAVARNRMRRRIYEIMREYNDLAVEPHDMVFTVYSDQLVDLDDQKLKTLIKEYLEKAKIIKG